MKEDISLFKYELAIVAILKNEAPYIKEWIDYHLLAGVEHFYLYDNDSEDNLREVLQPYIKADVVDCESVEGKNAQMFVYNAAVDKLKFECRYLAFIDADEFLLPRGSKSVKDVLHEVLDADPDAVALTVNWHVFGSGKQEKADFSRGVIERFLYRTPDDFEVDKQLGNSHIKTIANPRGIELMLIPHFAKYFNGLKAVDENGNVISSYFNTSVPDEKIIINHYYIKSKEEFIQKVSRGRADTPVIVRKMEDFDSTDEAATVFDDSILKYRQARYDVLPDENNSVVIDLEPIDAINARRFNALVHNLMPAPLRSTSAAFFDGKLHTFLTCRAVSRSLSETDLEKKTANFFEELSLLCVYRSLASERLQAWQLLLLIKELPKILSLEYEAVDDIKFACRNLIPQLMNYYRLQSDWSRHEECKYIFNMITK